MFTSNYSKFKTAEFNGDSLTLKLYDGTSATISADKAARAYIGDIGCYMRKAHCGSLAAGANSSTPMDQCKPGIYFGSGVTAPTANDYTLEYPIITGLSITNATSGVLNYDNKRYRFCTTIALTNNVSIDITVAEIGLFGQALYNTVYKPVLFERTVLETPVVIGPGQTKVIQYWVEINQYFGGA